MVLRGVAQSRDSWSPTEVTEDRRQTLLACMTACAVALLLLARPLQHMDAAIWGPSDPWNNGDFLGAHWLFWAVQQPGDATTVLLWPWGETDLWTAFPNPFDAWLFSGIAARIGFPLGWNLMMVVHHLLNVVGTVVLARSVGLRPLHAAAAGALIAATPIMLHEHAMGHTLTAAVWPGLFGLAALSAGKGLQAGLWIGVQGLAYLYTGLMAGIVALIVRPTRGLLLALLVVAPYLWHLSPQLEAATAVAPPDGFTSLPIDGLLGSAQQFHIRLFPVIFLGVLAPFVGPHRSWARRAVMAATLLFIMAIGPEGFLHRGDSPAFQSPAGLLFSIPGLDRMHHPVRLAMLAAPLLAVATFAVLHRRRAIWALAGIGLCGLQWRVIDNTAAWSTSGTMPGLEAAEWLEDHATAVVDLGSSHMQSLSLQTIHGKPVLAGLHPRTNPPPHVDQSLLRRVTAWAEGDVQEGLPARLRQLGFSHVIVVDRGPGRTPDASAVETQLGAPVKPGIYAL